MLKQTSTSVEVAEGFLPTRHSLLSRLRDLDDQRSWRDFFDTYWKLIYSAATKCGLSDAEAQDVVQETVITVSRKIGDFKYDPAAGSFKGWLLNTTRWRIQDHIRKRSPGSHSLADEATPRKDDPLAEIPDPTASVLDATWEAEWQKNLLDAALERVKRQAKPKHFQIFELYTLKKWPAAQVASTLAVSTGFVHLTVHRISHLIKKEVRRLEKQNY